MIFNGNSSETDSGYHDDKVEEATATARSVMRDQLIGYGWSASRAEQRAETVDFRVLLEQEVQNLSEAQLGSLAVKLGIRLANKYRTSGH